MRVATKKSSYFEYEVFNATTGEIVERNSIPLAPREAHQSTADSHAEWRNMVDATDVYAGRVYLVTVVRERV